MTDDNNQKNSSDGSFSAPIEVETISPNVRDTITYQHTLDANAKTTAHDFFASETFDALTQLSDGGLTLGKVIGRGMGVVHEALSETARPHSRRKAAVSCR